MNIEITEEERGLLLINCTTIAGHEFLKKLSSQEIHLAAVVGDHQVMLKISTPHELQTLSETMEKQREDTRQRRRKFVKEMNELHFATQIPISKIAP